MANNKALTVFKASAGSGKTFKLALEFIKILVVNPRKYENILAVTFTNKATEEMKHRIVSQLYGLSHRFRSSDAYMEKICSELDMAPEVVSERATIALHNLLHNYSRFRVQTIDAFFQTILRNMAKELGLGNNMRISINDDQVIHKSVDTMLETLDRDKKLMSWIMEYVNDNMDNSSSWRITDSIKKFGENLKSEFFKRNEHMLDQIESDGDFFTAYKAELKKLYTGFEDKYRKRSKMFFELLSTAGFSIDDLSYRNTSAAGYFLKLGNGLYDMKDKDLLTKRVLASIDDPSTWYSAKSPQALKDLAESQLTPFLRDTELMRKADLRIQKSAKLTIENINNMRLLFNIRKEMEEQNKTNSQFMLSNTQTLLNEMIQAGSNEAPFIFEKIGAFLEHIMIDEFQDTSVVQWKNFKILLKECMSNAGEELTEGGRLINNLIVGDVKQSIYRFRNGDWRLLNDIEDEFDPDQLNIESLQTNWRSERNVIDFNNAFFKRACSIVADEIMPEDETAQKMLTERENLSGKLVNQRRMFAKDIRHAYDDVEQKIPEFRPERGFVRMEFMPAKTVELQKTEAAERTIEYVRSLIASGAEQKDIAILVRKNGEASFIANAFAINAPELNIISDQAFALEASPLVMMLVNAIKFIHGKDRTNATYTLLKLYCEYILETGKTDSEVLIDKESFAQYMPKEITDPESIEKLRFLSLDELSEELFRILQLDRMESQHSYASTFFDNVKNFIHERGSMPHDFIDYWEEELHGKSISIGNSDCIRVVTIHKSKGLEYPHVIVPFATWSIVPGKKQTLWCFTDQEPYSDLPFIPVSMTHKADLDNSIYEAYGTDEWMQTIVDNLNGIYVAFTRAGRSLFIISSQNMEGGTCSRLLCDTAISLVEDNALHEIVTSGLDEMMEKINAKKSPGKQKRNEEKSKAEKEDVVFSFQFGENVFEKEKKENRDCENIFETVPDTLYYTVKSFSNSNVKFRQSNKSREFADEELDDSDRKRFTTMGSIMHMLFSQIQTLDDVERTLRQFEFDGVIYNDDVTAEELREKLREKFCIPMVKSWFSDEWTVFNECNIMRLIDGRIVEDRPDRVITNGKQTVVIDYKFGKRNKKYAEQVQRYMSLMKEMNYPDVKGYIWYVNEDDGVVEV